MGRKKNQIVPRCGHLSNSFPAAPPQPKKKKEEERKTIHIEPKGADIDAESMQLGHRIGLDAGTDSNSKRRWVVSSDRGHYADEVVVSEFVECEHLVHRGC